MTHQNPSGLAFNDLLCQIANQTNATEKIVKESLHEGVLTRVFQAFIEGGGVRAKGTSIRGWSVHGPRSVIYPTLNMRNTNSFNRHKHG